MPQLDATHMFVSFILTWSVGLAPPLLVRFIFLRRPLGKLGALALCAAFFILSRIVFVYLGGTSHIPVVWSFVAIISFFILRYDSAKATEHPPADESTMWRYKVGAKEYGPLSEAELRFHILSESIQPKDLVLPPQSNEWIPAADAPKFYNARNG